MHHDILKRLDIIKNAVAIEDEDLNCHADSQTASLTVG